jgi:plasmid stabilization system protein ParE
MKIRWTQEALDRLLEIEAFISLDSPERAFKFVNDIIDHTEKALSDRIRLGRMVVEISNPNIREIIFKKYRIIYRLNKNQVEILTVFEGHRLLRIDEIERA